MYLSFQRHYDVSDCCGDHLRHFMHGFTIWWHYSTKGTFHKMIKRRMKMLIRVTYSLIKTWNIYIGVLPMFPKTGCSMTYLQATISKCYFYTHQDCLKETSYIFCSIWSILIWQLLFCLDYVTINCFKLYKGFIIFKSLFHLIIS